LSRITVDDDGGGDGGENDDEGTLIPPLHWHARAHTHVHNVHKYINACMGTYTHTHVRTYAYVHTCIACKVVTFLDIILTLVGGTWSRSWLRHCSTNRKVVGSIPDGVIGIFHLHNPSGRTMVLGRLSL
jgi:hypothetical protein